MATFNELIYLLKDIPRQGDGESRSNNYTDRELAFIINYYRAKIIAQQLSKNKEVDSAYLQTLGKIELVKSSKNECCLPDCDINDIIVRTSERLPSFISSKGNSVIPYIGTIDGSYKFTKTSFNKTEFDKYSIFTSKRTKYYEIENYIYITNPPTSSFKYLLVQGVFEAPEAANEFHTCGCTTATCEEGYNFNYPIKVSDIDTLLKMVIESEYRFANILPKDTLNDSRDAN
jgi:hypothetical protein